MDSATKQSKATDSVSPNKSKSRKKRNASPKKALLAQTPKVDNASVKDAPQVTQKASIPNASTANGKVTRRASSPKKKSPQKQTSPTKMPQKNGDFTNDRPTHTRAYSSPFKQTLHEYRATTVCRYWLNSRCNLGESCPYLHEQPGDGATGKTEASSVPPGNKQEAVSTTAPPIFDPRACYQCGGLGHPRKDCPTLVASIDSAAQLSSEVSKILAADLHITPGDEDAFFTSLDLTNSQALTDYQTTGKLSESTIRRFLHHAFTVRQASQEAMKLAYQSGRADDYEKANSLDELAKEILNTPGLSLERMTVESVMEVTTRPLG